MSKHGRVLVAMSGGIDSTVTAMMMHEQGYEVVGITMKTWDYANSGGTKKETGCCSLDSINDARKVAVDMGFHHFIVDIREDFGDYVIDNFVDEYMAGRTPNPCVYAKINEANGRKFISKAVDSHKDQSYVLWGLSQECMDRSRFPLGPYTKPEVRQMAADFGYIDLSKKGESYEICFVPDNDYRGFLKRRVDGLEERVAGGNFVSPSGEILGQHDGYPFYTIGQRKGLKIAFGTPKYVTEIRPETNTVVLGDTDDLIKNGMTVSQLNAQKYATIPDGLEVVSKIRYGSNGYLSKIVNTDDTDKLSVEFMANVKGVAPGQSAVFYEGDDVVGGGLIYNGFLNK